MIRDVLLGIYGAGWLMAVAATLIRGQLPDAELWAALGVGCGGLLAVFAMESRGRAAGSTRARNPKENDE